MAKFTLDTDNFKGILSAIQKLGGNAKEATDKTLKEIQDYIQSETKSASSTYASKGGGKGYSTGRMYASINQVPSDVPWEGSTASVEVGFKVRSGGKPSEGFPSIFIMYGTPRMSADPAVYEAIRGSATRNKVEEIQRNALEEMFKRLGK